MMKKNIKNQNGFTLVEVLISIALLTISAGVASDIILTLVQSYNKTQIQNELEANGNFVLQKIERELQNAVDFEVSDSGKTLTIQKNEGTTTVNIVYRIQVLDSVGSITRQEGTGAAEVITNNNSPNGVNVDESSVFRRVVSGSVRILEITLNLSQIDDGVGNPAFTGSLPLKSTIILRNLR